jgi:hypothetical protein
MSTTKHPVSPEKGGYVTEREHAQVSAKSRHTHQGHTNKDNQTDDSTDMQTHIQAALDARNYYMARYRLKQAIRGGCITDEEQQRFETAIDALSCELEQERIEKIRCSRQRRLKCNTSPGSPGNVPIGQSPPDQFERSMPEISEP